MTLSLIGTTVLVVLLCAYVCSLIAIGRYAARKVDDAGDYLLAGRSVPLGLSVLSLLATWFGSTAILGATRNAYELGLSGTVLEPFACAATLALTGFLFARPLWKHNIASVADLFRERMGPVSQWISCLIQIPTFFCWIGAQYLSIGAMLDAYLGLPMGLGTVASCAVVLLILWSGGMWAVTWTNAFLVALSIASVVILFFGTAMTVGNGDVLAGVRRVLEQTPREQWFFFPDLRWSAVLGVFGVFLTGLLGNIPGQDLQQRVLCAKSPEVARWSCVISSVLYLAVGCIPIFVGFAARMQLSDRITDADVQGDQVLPVAASHFLSEPYEIVLLLGLISVNLAVAASSTISQTTLLANNVLGGWQPNQSGSPIREKACVVAVCVGSLVAAFSGKSLMGLLEISLVIVMVALFVPMCFCLFARSIHPWMGVASMVSGAAVWGIHVAAESWLGYDSPGVQNALEPYPAWSIYLDVPAEIQGLAASLIAAVVLQSCRHRTSANTTAD